MKYTNKFIYLRIYTQSSRDVDGLKLAAKKLFKERKKKYLDLLSGGMESYRAYNISVSYIFNN